MVTPRPMIFRLKLHLFFTVQMNEKLLPTKFVLKIQQFVCEGKFVCLCGFVCLFVVDVAAGVAAAAVAVVVVVVVVFAYCKGGNFNIHIWAWFGYFICSPREISFYL